MHRDDQPVCWPNEEPWPRSLPRSSSRSQWLPPKPDWRGTAVASAKHADRQTDRRRIWVNHSHRKFFGSHKQISRQDKTLRFDSSKDNVRSHWPRTGIASNANCTSSGMHVRGSGWVSLELQLWFEGNCEFEKVRFPISIVPPSVAMPAGSKTKRGTRLGTLSLQEKSSNPTRKNVC